MARPTKAGEEKRTAQINLRLTEAEMAGLRLDAAKAGVPVSDYVRRSAIGQSVSMRSASRTDPALITELNRIGVNVNQLARAHHRDSAFVAYWREVGAELEAVLTRVLGGGDGSDNHR